MSLRNALCAMAFCVLTAAPLAGCVQSAPVPDMSAAVTSLSGDAATLPFLLDNNRVFVEVEFIKSDGTPRRALAFVNMGNGAFVVSNALFRELEPGPLRRLRLRFGGLEAAIDGALVRGEGGNGMAITLNPFAEPMGGRTTAQGPGGQLAASFAPLKVEAIIPSGLLQHFTVTFDYGALAMTLARPGVSRAEGVAVPIRVNRKTGFAVLDAVIAGTPQQLVIDNGGSYSGARDTTAWRQAHPGWLRSIGGIGAANYSMSALDVGAPVVKAGPVSLGMLTLPQVGLVETSTTSLGWLGGTVSSGFWKSFSEKSGGEVSGWIGGNILKSFRLTLDYAGNTSYWLQRAPLETDELQQVGLILGRDNGHYIVRGIALKDGRPSVAGVEVGDLLLQVDAVRAEEASAGQILAALHGKPGERRHLILERDGVRIEQDALVTAF